MKMDLWERGLHTILVGGAESKGAVREGRASSGGEKEEIALACKFHSMILSGKICLAVRQSTNRERGGCLLLDDICTKTSTLVVEVLW